jgi:glycosyltransferase involved in cell wall biosynthesis
MRTGLPLDTMEAPEEGRRERGGFRSIDHELATVVIPARNEARSIGRCLESVLRQDHWALQVVVVDAASEDRTAEIVREYAGRDPRVELVRNPGGTIPSSLNTGLRHARGRWLVRMDAHSLIPPHYVRVCLENLATGRWGGVGGGKHGVGQTPTGRAIAAALSSRFGVGNSIYHYGSRKQPVDHVPYGVYPTHLLRCLGGWNESILANEDYELDYRVRQLGLELLFDPSVTIEWQSRQTIRELFDQYRRYGRGKASVVRLHPKSIGARHVAAPALVVLLGGSGILLAVRSRLAMPLMAPYSAALTAATATVVTRERDVRAAPWVPAAFLAMHVGWGVGFWEGILGARPTAP